MFINLYTDADLDETDFANKNVTFEPEIFTPLKAVESIHEDKENEATSFR